MKLSNWTVDGIKDIKEIHTLINAVHQTSIQDFKQEMKDLDSISTRVANTNSVNIRHSTERANSRPIQVMTASQESTISGYNLSNTINSNIVRFLSKLATRKLPYDKIDDFICKDDLIVWTTRLNAHSVDVFFNFGDVDRGISIFGFFSAKSSQIELAPALETTISAMAKISLSSFFTYSNCL